MAFRFNWSASGVTASLHGRTSSREIAEAIRQVYSSERFEALKYVVVDFLDVDGYEFDRSSADDIAALRIGGAYSNRRLRCAFVSAPSVEIEGAMAYQNEQCADALAPIRLFGTRKAASDWAGEALLP